MRNWINLVTETHHGDLDWAVEQLNDSIMHNHDIDDAKVRRVLDQHGYVEPNAQIPKVLRALSLPIPDEDVTCGDLVARYADDLSWYRTDTIAQSCAADIGDIMTFLRSEQHMLGYPIFHSADTSVRDIRAFYVIAEFSVSANSVIWSIDGLVEFSKTHAGMRDMLREAMWEYGTVREIKIAASGLTPVSVIPCDDQLDQRY